MKKVFLAVLSLVLLTMLVGCNTAETAETQPNTQSLETTVQEVVTQIPPITCDPAKSVDFSSLMEELSEVRRAQMAVDADWSGLQDYVGEEVELVTAAEWKLLTDPNNPRNEFVTYEEAVADIDLLFRAYEEAYGAYHYFGAEQFQQAKEEILSWLEGQQTVVSPELHQVYLDSMHFLQDRHAACLEPGSEEYLRLRYEYFYAEGWEFTKDESGFYAMSDGTKWYVDRFSDDLISIEYKLCNDGRIVYAPVLFCPVPEAEPCDITLHNESGDTITQEITWTQGGQPMFNTPDIQHWEEDGVAYLSVRSFSRDPYGTELQRNFVSTGAELKDAKLVILDLRGNHGGDSRFGSEWIYNLTGKWPSTEMGIAHRGDALARITFPDMSRSEDVTIVDGEFQENDIPIVVLVDSQVASSGETLLQELRTLENVIVVGSNTMGCDMCGNVSFLQLPNTGIPVFMGIDLYFASDSMENLDYRGFAPDVWCDPVVSVDAVLEMLRCYGLAEDNTVNALQEREKSRPGVVNLLLWDSFVFDGEMMGTPDLGAHLAPVYLNGEPTEDFTVEGDAEWVRVTKVEGGIQFDNLQAGTGNTCPITVTIGDDCATFWWYAG